MRILFAGSPEIAIPSLQMLASEQILHKHIEVCAVLTKADAVKGRGSTLSPSPLSAAAVQISGKLEAAGFKPIMQYKPAQLDQSALAEIAGLHADILVSFAYGKIFTEPFLALFPKGAINIHPSLLPKYRGPTPIQQAILDRESKTGVTIQRISREVDRGDILAQEEFPLNGSETTDSLSTTIAQKAAAMLRTVIIQLADGTDSSVKQDDSQAVYCQKIKKEDGLINWKRSALEIDAQIRAFTPWPLCWTHHNNQELYILAGTAQADIIHSESGPAGAIICASPKQGIVIQTGSGIFRPARLQYKTKKALDWKDFLNGARFTAGEILH